MPPEVMAVDRPVTVPSSVVPLLSNSLPTIAPLVPQSTSRRYQWLAWYDWFTAARFV